MVSQIDPTYPRFSEATTQSVRDNFAAAKSEIEALQTGKADVTLLANFLPLTGGTMQGNILLPTGTAPSSAAATRAYVDERVTTAGANFLPLTGGTLTGALILADDPTTPLGAVTMRYVTNNYLPLTGGIISGSLQVLATPSETNSVATKTWVETLLSGAVGIVEAPMDGFTYGRRNAGWQRFESLPVGVMMDWPKVNPPTGWLMCDGREVSRVAYAALFSVVGTDFGEGDGETTFNLPDFRGRTSIGLDVEVDGAYALRVTATISGIDATVMGAAGGSQYAPAHTHDLNDPGHAHSVNDPGHNHTVSDPTHNHGLPQTGHAHAIGDPGHGHSIADGGHTHLLPAATDVVGIAGGNVWALFSANYSLGTSISGTGIGIYGAGTGVYVGAQNANVSINAAYSGVWNNASGTGIGVISGGTGITLDVAGQGASQNVQPSLVVAKIIYAGA